MAGRPVYTSSSFLVVVAGGGRRNSNSGGGASIQGEVAFQQMFKVNACLREVCRLYLAIKVNVFMKSYVYLLEVN